MSKINPEYLKEQSILSFKDSLASPFPAITLHSFFTEESYLALANATHRLSYEKEYAPDKYFYRCAPIPKKMLEFLHSEEFLSLLSAILEKDITQLDQGRCYQFGWKNYTLLHDDILLTSGVDIIFDFTPSWNEDWGGAINYTEPGQESAELLSIPNSFHLIKRSDDIQRFIKYVNHHANDHKRIFVMVTLPDED